MLQYLRQSWKMYLKTYRNTTFVKCQEKYSITIKRAGKLENSISSIKRKKCKLIKKNLEWLTYNSGVFLPATTVFFLYRSTGRDALQSHWAIWLTCLTPDALQKASERLLLVEKVDKTMDNMYSASIPNKIHLKHLKQWPVSSPSRRWM